MVAISKRTKFVHVSRHKGRVQPVNAVAGANDTGEEFDSPCPSKTATAELKMLTDLLEIENIQWEETSGNTMNVFCISRYIITRPKDRKRAAELAESLKPKTRLLYAINDEA